MGRCSVGSDRVFFFNDPATTEIYTLSLHDALPIYLRRGRDGRRLRRLPLRRRPGRARGAARRHPARRRAANELRSEEHTSELQSRQYLVCRLLLEKKKTPSAHHPNLAPLPSPSSAS